MLNFSKATLRSSFLPLILLVTPAFAHAQLSAARVMSVSGDVRVVDAQGKSRALEKGTEIKAGEKIVTADGALAQIRLNDGGFMSIRPGTEMVIDRFNYDEKNAANSSLLVSLLRGGMRSISGLIGKTNPDGYQIKSGTATVGIRGTDHEPMVIPPNVPELVKLGVPGLYDKVNEGETFIRNQGGLLSIKRGEVGFAPVANANLPPQALRVIPDFYKIDLKVDARDPKEAASIDGAGRREAVPATGGLLRPSTAARREALDLGGTVQPVKSDVLTDRTLSTTTVNPAVTSTVIAPSTARVLQPAAVVDSGATLTTAPLVSATVVSPVVTTVTPIATTAPLVTTAPALTTVSPIIAATVISPVTTTVAPATTTVSPTTTLSPTLSTTTINKTLILK